MTGPTALLLALALGAEGRLDAGLRVGVAASRTTPAAPADERSIDLVAAPAVSLDVRGRTFSAAGGYSPTFTAVDLGPDEHGAVLHAGQLRLGLEPHPVLRLELAGSGAAGQTSQLTSRASGAAGNQSPGSGAVSDTITTTRYVRIERFTVGGSLRLAPGRRSVYQLYGGILQEGGTDAFSRQTNPVLRALEATGEARWNASRVDVVGLRAAAFQGRIASRRSESAWASAMATWRHRLSPRVETWGGAGAVLFWSRVPEATRAAARTTSGTVEPAGELGVARGAVEPLDMSAQLAASQGATADRLTGETSPRFELAGDLRWPIDRRVALTAQATGSITWPKSGTTRYGRAQLGSDFRLTTWASLQLSIYGTRQRSTDPDLAPVDAYGAALSVSIAAPTVRF